MKKVVLDARMIPFSGIGTYLKSLIPGLKREVDLLLLVSPTAERWIKDMPHRICYSPIYSIREQVELPYIIPPCDIFWSPHFNIPLLPIRAKKRVVTIHDTYHLAFLSSLSFREKLYAKIVYNQAVIRSDLVITVSQFSSHELQKYTKVDKNKIRVIHNGIEIKKKGENRHGLYFLFVGNWKPNKNLKNLIAAFRMIKEEIKLIIVGKKEGFRHGEELLLPKNCIALGTVSDEELSSLYGNALALVFPSLYEGFGYPPVEAMGYGCPVIASNSCSIPEVCGAAALYVDPLNPLEIASAMERISKDRRLSMALKEKGERRVKELSIEKCVKNHVNVLKNL